MVLHFAISFCREWRSKGAHNGFNILSPPQVLENSEANPFIFAVDWNYLGLTSKHEFETRWTFQPLFPGIYIQIWYTTYDSIICNGTPNFQVGKSIGTDRLKIDESEKNLTFTCKFLLAITASSVWPNNITEHRSFVMFFQAFTAASFSCCLFWGISPYSLLFCR